MRITQKKKIVCVANSPNCHAFERIRQCRPVLYRMSLAGGMNFCGGRGIPGRVIMNVGVRTVNNYGLFRDICRVRACPHGVEASTSCILKPRGGIYSYYLLETVEKPWLTRNNRPICSRLCSQHFDHSLRWSRRKLDDHHLLAPLHSKDEWKCYWARQSSSSPTISSRRIPDSVFLRQVLYDRTMIVQCLLIC